MADPGTPAAMADQAAVADPATMADPGIPAAMADQAAMADSGIPAAMAEQGARAAMAEQGAWDASMAEQETSCSYSPWCNIFVFFKYEGEYTSEIF